MERSSCGSSRSTSPRSSATRSTRCAAATRRSRCSTRSLPSSRRSRTGPGSPASCANCSTTPAATRRRERRSSSAPDPSPKGVVIAVTDRGEGLDRAVAAKSFEEPFTTGEGTLRKEKAGVGVGLHLARQMIVEHGGILWTDPLPGGGTRAAFCIPVRGDGRRPLPPPAWPEPRAATGLWRRAAPARILPPEDPAGCAEPSLESWSPSLGTGCAGVPSVGDPPDLADALLIRPSVVAVLPGHGGLRPGARPRRVARHAGRGRPRRVRGLAPAGGLAPHGRLDHRDGGDLGRRHRGRGAVRLLLPGSDAARCCRS